MVARCTLGTHRCEQDTLLADNRSTDLRLVAMRGAAPPSTLSRRHTTFLAANQGAADAHDHHRPDDDPRDARLLTRASKHKRTRSETCHH
jgi:hypothetical protein